MPRRRRNILRKESSLGLVLIIVAGITLVLVGSANQIMVVGINFQASGASVDFDEVNSNAEYRILDILVPAYNPFPLDGLVSDMNFTLYGVKSGEIVGQGRIIGPLKIPAGSKTNFTIRIALRNSTEIVNVLKETIKTGVLSLSITGKYRLSIFGMPIIPLPFTTALPIPIGDMLASIFTADTMAQIGGSMAQELTVPLPIYEGMVGDKARFRFQIPFQVPNMDFGEIVLRNAMLYVNSSGGEIGSVAIDYLKLLPGTRSVLDVRIDLNVGPNATGTIQFVRDVLDKRKIDLGLKFIGDIELFGILLPNIEFPASGQSFRFVYNLPDSATLGGLLANYISEDFILSALNQTGGGGGGGGETIKNPSIKYLGHDEEWIYTKIEFTVKIPKTMSISTWDIPITLYNLTGYLLFDRGKHMIFMSAVKPNVRTELIVGRVRMYQTEFSLDKEFSISLFFDFHKVEATRLFLIQLIKHQILYMDIEGYANISILGMNIGEISVKFPLKLTNKTIAPLLQMLLPTILASRYYPPSGGGGEQPPPIIVLNRIYSGEHNQAYHDVYIELAVRNIQMIPIFIRFFEFEYFYNDTKIGTGRILQQVNFTSNDTNYSNFTLFIRIYNQTEAVADLLRILIFNWTILGKIRATIDIDVAEFRLGILDGIEFELFYLPSGGGGGGLPISFGELFQLQNVSFKQLIKSATSPEFNPNDGAPSPLPSDWDGVTWTGNYTNFKRAILRLALGFTTSIDFIEVNDLSIGVYPDPNDPLYGSCGYLDVPAIEAKVLAPFSLTNASSIPVEVKLRAVIYRHTENPLSDPTYIMFRKVVMEMATPPIKVKGYANLVLFGIPIMFEIPAFAVSEIFLLPLLGGSGTGGGSLVNSSIFGSLGSMASYNVTDVVPVEDTGLPHTLSRDGSNTRANPFAAFPDTSSKQWSVFDLFLSLRQDFVHVYLFELSMPVYSPRAKNNPNASIDSRYIVGFGNKSYIGQVLLPGTIMIPPLYGESPILLDESRFYLDYTGCSVYPFNPAPYELKPGIPTKIGFRFALRRTPAPYVYVPKDPNDPNKVYLNYVNNPQYYNNNPSPAWDFTSLLIYGLEYFGSTPSLANNKYDQIMSVWAWANESVNAYAKFALFWPDWQLSIYLGTFLSGGIPLATNLSSALNDIANGLDIHYNQIQLITGRIVGPWYNPGIVVELRLPIDYNLPTMAPVWLASLKMGMYYGGAGSSPDVGSTRKWADIVWPTSYESPLFYDPLGSGRLICPVAFMGTPSRRITLSPYVTFEFHVSDLGQIIWDIITRGGFWLVFKNVKPIMCTYGYIVHYLDNQVSSQWIKVI
ncbi:MAG: hypothetical protein QXL15_02205 [Candidatus Korarchaeota archaeon]